MLQENKTIVSKEELLKYTLPLNVLYVEDDELIAKAALGTMGRYFNSIDLAVNGQNGLDIYRKDYHDIVISDIQMPILDGISMVAEIKKINPEQYIIITSASDDSEKLITLIDIGVDKFLLKPIRRNKLLDVIYLISKNISIGRELNSYKKYLEEINRYNQEEQIKAHLKQKSIIKNDIESSSDFIVDILYKPSDILSGDSYSIYKRADGSLLIYVIDAMGHGLLPSLTSFAISSSVKRFVDSEQSLEEFSTEFIKTIQNTLVEEEQLSCVFVEIDSSYKKLSYFSAGMYPPVLQDGHNLVHLKTNNHPFMNFDESIKIDTIELEDFRIIVLFTDGVLESNDTALDLTNTETLLVREEFIKRVEELSSIDLPDDSTMIRIERR